MMTFLGKRPFALRKMMFPSIRSFEGSVFELKFSFFSAISFFVPPFMSLALRDGVNLPGIGLALGQMIQESDLLGSNFSQ
jgi:hypothetical protein